MIENFEYISVIFPFFFWRAGAHTSFQQRRRRETSETSQSKLLNII